MSHPTREQLEQYISHTLNPSDLLYVDDHIQSCESCLRILERNVSQSPFPILSRQLFEGDIHHLTEEELHSVVDGTVTGGNLNLHLQNCEECRDQLDQLKAVRFALRRNTIPFRRIRSSWAIAAIFTTLVLAGALLFRTLQIATPEIPQIARSSEIELSLNEEGGTIHLLKDGSMQGLENASKEEKTNLARALRTGSAAVPDWMKTFDQQKEILLGRESEGEPFQLFHPVGLALATDQPDFSWKPLQNAKAYKVQIFDEQFHAVSESPWIARTSWKIGAHMKRDRLYLWQVVADSGVEKITSPQAPFPPAKFRIIDEQSYFHIERLRKSKPASHSLLGLAYAEAGMLAEAEKEFEILKKLNPGSDIPRRILFDLNQKGSPTSTKPAQ